MNMLAVFGKIKIVFIPGSNHRNAYMSNGDEIFQ
jgi:hypothetical protein